MSPARARSRTRRAGILIASIFVRSIFATTPETTEQGANRVVWSAGQARRSWKPPRFTVHAQAEACALRLARRTALGRGLLFLRPRCAEDVAHRVVPLVAGV